MKILNDILAASFVSCLVLNSVALKAEDQKSPPNVLFIAIDDLRTELGCYGLPYVHSPNLDRFASEGVLFTNHFVQVPTCGASRFALLTGRSPGQSGVTRNNQAFYSGSAKLSIQKTAGAQTLPELFRRNGYHTVSIGKISHTPDGRVYAYNGKGDGRDELPHAWDELATPFGSWKRGWGTFFAYANGRHREDGKGHKDLMEFVVEKDEDLPDGLMALKACQKLTQLKSAGKPFFMGLGFFKPHLPFVATKADWDAMSKVDVPPPPQAGKLDSPYWHTSGEFYKYKTTIRKTRPLSQDDQIKARRAYLACVRYVDRQVGKVLKQLDDLGLRESTIVVVWGDHGWHLGDSAIWGKHSPFERALNSTLIIRAPGVSTAGHQSRALVETVDIFPTLVDLCGLAFTKTEHTLDGRSLKPLMTREKSEIREAAVSYWKSAISVRIRNYRLITTKRKGSNSNIELYDMRESPDPVNNLAESEPELVKRLLEYIPSR